MLRTIAEIRAGRVTIQETDSGTTVTVSVDNAQSTQLLPGERLYTSAEVGDLQALVGRLGLRARAEVLYPERLAGDSASFVRAATDALRLFEAKGHLVLSEQTRALLRESAVALRPA